MGPDLLNANQADSVHAVSVAHFGAHLANIIKRNSLHWMSQACCPACGSLFPAFVSPSFQTPPHCSMHPNFAYPQALESDAFNLVEAAGGHGGDFGAAPFFDHENMHAEMEEVWDITSNLSEVTLGPTAERTLAAMDYAP